MFSSNSPDGVSSVGRIVDRAFEVGINYIDTAPAYGESEIVLGKILKGNKSCILSTKIGGRPVPFNPRDKSQLRKSVEESLQALNRDKIELLLIHEPDRPRQYDWFADPERVVGPVTEFLQELKSEHLVSYTGLAGTTAYEMASLIEKGSFDVVLTAFNYSLLWQEAARSVIPAAKKKGMGIVVGSPLQHGALAARYSDEIERGARWMSPPRREQFRRLYALVDELNISVPELGLRFLLSNENISSVLTGVKSVEELELNAEFVEHGVLSPDVMSEIGSIAAMVPYRPYEEPYKLPFGLNYRGPGHIGHL